MLPSDVKQCDLTQFEFANPRFDLLAVADDDPDEIVRLDDVCGGLVDLGQGQAANAFCIRIPIVVRETVSDDLPDVPAIRRDAVSQRPGRLSVLLSLTFSSSSIVAGRSPRYSVSSRFNSAIDSMVLSVCTGA